MSTATTSHRQLLIGDTRKLEWIFDACMPAAIFGLSFIFSNDYRPVVYLLQGLSILLGAFTVYTLVYRPMRRVEIDTMRGLFVITDSYLLGWNKERVIPVSVTSGVHAIALKDQHTGNAKYRLRLALQNGGVVALGFTSMRDNKKMAEIMHAFEAAMRQAKPRRERQARLAQSQSAQVAPVATADPFRPNTLTEAADRMAEAIGTEAQAPARRPRVVQGLKR
jgi:hypothetical protein